MSIRVRLTVWYTSLLTVILIGVGVVLYTLFAHSSWTRAEDSVRGRAMQLTSFLESSDRGREEGTFFDLADPSVVDRFSTDGMLIQIRDIHGNVVNRSRALMGLLLGSQTAAQRALDGRGSLGRAVVADVGPVLVYTGPIIDRGSIIGVIQVGTPVAPIAEPLDRLRWLLLAVGSAAAIVAAVGGHLLASLALAPIDQITTTARTIAGGTLSRRLHLAGANDEVRRLAQAFDEMLDRIDETLARERQFTADAAHELRTPLTILKGELDVALRRERRPEEYRTTMVSMAQEVDRLVHLVEDLLILARADAGRVPLDLRPVAVDALIRWAEAQFKGVAQKKTITVKAEGTALLTVFGDLGWLRQLLTNLIDNAIAYTPPEGTVHLTWDRDRAFARVRVVDTGCGIDPIDLPRLFDRFYRADRARVRSSGGSGLGLAIAQWIVKAHEGRIEIESHPGSGSAVTVWLPLADVSTPQAAG
jgi:two-component system OmpR family sensor kinase